MPENRLDWFCDARFGMFIHWGLYSIPARGEWVMQNEKTPPEQYEKYFRQFNPQSCDMREWARAAKKAGMRYMVLTAKHHDGFCLFDSKLTDYKSTKTAAGRDFVCEFLEAGRAEGLKVGLYYSLLDWHHPDYPKYHDENHPLYGNPEYLNDTYNFDNYLDYMHGQVKELVAGYGKLDILWFDFSYHGMSGEKWRATELVDMIRTHQPDIILNNRLEVNAISSMTYQAGQPLPYSADFVSPEQSMPVKSIRDTAGHPVPWEVCFTMNNSWGYHAADNDYKRPALLVHKLVEAVSKGGNLILNVGPDANGLFPKKATEVLAGIGDWVLRNGESIYACGDAEIPAPEWGRYTRCGNTLYAHLFEEPVGPIPLTGLAPEDIGTVHLLMDGSEVLDASDALVCRHGSPYKYVTLCPQDPNYTRSLPDPWDTVLKIQLK